MLEAAITGGAQFAAYLVIAVNMRAVAHARYAWIAVTDAATLAIQFQIVRRIAQADDAWSLTAYVTGGTLGALVGVWLSRRWSE